MEEKQALQIFLEALLSPVGAGVFLWGAVAFVIKAIPFLDAHSEGKFWLSFLMSMLIPPAAFGLQIWLGYATFTPEAMFTTIGVAFMTSQGVHRGTSAVRAKVAENEEKAREEETKAMAAQPQPYFVGSIPQGHHPPTLPIAPAAPRFEDTDYTNSGDAIPFPDGERGASGGR